MNTSEKELDDQSEPDVSSPLATTHKHSAPPDQIFLCPWAGATAAELVPYTAGYARLFPTSTLTLLTRDHEILPSEPDIGSWPPELEAALEHLKTPPIQTVLIHRIGLAGDFSAAQLLYWHRETIGRPLNVRCVVCQPAPRHVRNQPPWYEKMGSAAWKALVGPSDEMVARNMSKHWGLVKGKPTTVTLGSDGDLNDASGSGLRQEGNWKTIEAAWTGEATEAHAPGASGGYGS